MTATIDGGEGGGRTSNPRFNVALLGGFALAYGENTIDIRYRKAEALIAHLALSPNLTATREQAAGLLWGDSPEAQARSSLRQVLRRLRQALDGFGVPVIEISHNSVRLNRDHLNVDVWELLDSLEQLSPHPAALEQKHPMETLLAGYEDLDSALRSWLLVQRQTLHDRVVLNLEAQLFEHGEDADPAWLQRTKNRAIALQNFDPTHERACRQLMRTAAYENDISGALRRYKALWDLLDSEYDMEPS